jgi:hypothetical protein
VLQTAIDGMRSDIKVAVDERNATQKKLVDVTDDLMNAVAERDKLEKLQRQLADQITKLKAMLAYANFTLGDMQKYAPPGLVGEVTSASRQDAVEISVGADDGVRKGHRFVVTRPSSGKYIGVVEVIRVEYPNRSVCRPDKALTSDVIQKGDRVEAETKRR